MKGTPPSARDSHSCTTIGDNLFVFGGTDGVKQLKDLHILETGELFWISLIHLSLPFIRVCFSLK